MLLQCTLLILRPINSNMNNISETTKNWLNITEADNRLDIKIFLDGSYRLVEWEYEQKKINGLNIDSLNIDCSIKYFEIESREIINFINDVFKKLAANLKNVSIKFSIVDLQEDLQEKDNCSDEYSLDAEFSEQYFPGCTENISEARDRWMKDLSTLQEGFKLLSSLEHFSFIFSAKDEIYDEFSSTINYCEDFLYLYNFNPILDLLKSQSVHKTLKSLSLELEYVSILDNKEDIELLKIFSENDKLQHLEIKSKKGFFLVMPIRELNYFIKKLILNYYDCTYDVELVSNTREIISQFPLSDLILHISSDGSHDHITEEVIEELYLLRKDILNLPYLEECSISGNDFDKIVDKDLQMDLGPYVDEDSHVDQKSQMNTGLQSSILGKRKFGFLKSSKETVYNLYEDFENENNDSEFIRKKHC